MVVANETLIAALKDLLQLEEVSVWNIAQVRRFDFSVYSPSEQKTIKVLLEKLREDTHQHQNAILDIVRRLSYDKKSYPSDPKTNIARIPQRSST